MPNHFLTVGLCARKHSDDDEQYIDWSPLENANLCELVSPMPVDLVGIVESAPKRYRVREVATGRVVTNEVGLLDGERLVEVPLSTEEEKQLIDTHGAASWYDWCNSTWGTKWGTYDTRIYEMGGDGSPILIEFQSAWGPPSPDTMAKITAHLEEHYWLSSIRWIGHDPHDGETCEVEVGGGHSE